MYDEYDDGEGGGASLGRKLALGVGVVAILAAGFFAFKAVTGGDGGDAVSGASTEPSASAAADDEGAPTTTAAPDDEDDTLSAGATTEPATSEATTTTDEDAPGTTAAATTTAAPAPPTTPAPAPPAPAAAPYNTLPDGSPQWATAIYDTDKITLTGTVPDEASRQKLQDLAILSAKPGQAATIDNQLTINPAVPRSVGVRVVELTSARFPEGSAEVLPAQAAELDRLVAILNGLTNVTVLVIGHADQRGDEVANYVISEARADAVTNYLAAQGVDPSRLASRAVGEADLLSLNNDDAALALNRRTEFVLYGLLQG
ncbi:MAG TPA: OmpA family protein [Ilumatobacteraceae bacterium]|nr:OmpA family protein [Ilumatobacteraceae bacterium]